MPETPVEVRGLVKTYGSIHAVDHVDLTVDVGEVYGYLGPNGAGKTTTCACFWGSSAATGEAWRCSGAIRRRL
jgi:ABC-2 type transport system ATP-binding protein